MASITDYSTTLIKIYKDANNISFAPKSGATVQGVGGKVVLSYTGGQYSVSIADLKSPTGNSLEDVVVAIQVIIDNV